MLAPAALALLEMRVAPYVVLDILDFWLAESSFEAESAFLHLRKISLIERLQRVVY
jgi:hypothetical protein